ncbi:MAG: membrane protein insertase YidC [Puniceicoccales bacterium]|jgi:YidC/Oxa1 family membrane protein insertase|nr:membrane protein insertase YidC [Puniceicoccales bacterium]
MDKKNQIIGILCVICAFVLMFKLDSSKHGAVSENEQRSSQAIQKKPIGKKNESKKTEKVARYSAPIVKDEKVVLENDLVKVEFSVGCGAIDRVFLKKYKKIQNGEDLIIFNEGERCPALGLLIGLSHGDGEAYVSGFSVKSFDDQAVVFSRIDEDGFGIERSYFLPKRDGKESNAYLIKHRTVLLNHSDTAMSLKKISLNLGSIPATEGDVSGDYLNFGYYDGKSAEFIKSRDFIASKGFFGLGKRDSRDYISEKRNIVWGSIKNQFFTAILTPSIRANGFCARPVLLNDSALGHKDEGIAAEMMFKIDDVAAQGEYGLDLDFYVGPKDLVRLDRMHNRQDLVMQFGFFGIISKFLLFIMLGIYSFLPNWGLAIILLTVVVKLCLWPLTTAQVRASKKMSAVQAPLKAIREKYKNNPSKIQSETMRLFKLHRINPAAGCLPIFIQIPIFFGLYFMLRTSSELRFAHFLWIKDLSIADTIAYISGFPVNILPLIMSVTMALQMHMTPMPSADGSSKTIFKLMPLIFLLCCYSFPSGLVLYWTVQNILTIVQQHIVSRRRDMQVERLLEADLPAKKGKHGRKKKDFTK